MGDTEAPKPTEDAPMNASKQGEDVKMDTEGSAFAEGSMPDVSPTKGDESELHDHGGAENVFDPEARRKAAQTQNTSRRSGGGPGEGQV